MGNHQVFTLDFHKENLIFLNMKVKDLILKEIEKIPDKYLGEVLDFIRFLETKTIEEKIGTAVASESSLGKDWLKAEEDKAWKNL